MLVGAFRGVIGLWGATWFAKGPPPLFVRSSAVLLGMCIPKLGSLPPVFPFAGRRFFSPRFPVRGRAGRPWPPVRPHSRPKRHRCRPRGGRERRWRFRVWRFKGVRACIRSSSAGHWPCRRAASNGSGRGRPSCRTACRSGSGRAPSPRCSGNGHCRRPCRG